MCFHPEIIERDKVKYNEDDAVASELLSVLWGSFCRFREQ
jgi:hypothetical protein